MTGKRRCLMLGAGGFAGRWIRLFLPPFADRLEVVGLVDVAEPVLAAGADFLGLPPRGRFTEMARAFEEADADCCIIAVPPAFHLAAVELAVARGLPILSEKPIADTWERCVAIFRMVKRAGIKMQVIQNYRYSIPMLTMRETLRRGELGRLNYISARFAADYRAYASWGAPFRHEIAHSLLVEGAVHHFDMLRNLTGSDCRTMAGGEWNPAWSSSKGEFCALYVIEMAHGERAVYEGSGTAAGELNSWHEEYYRAECEGGAITVGADHTVRVLRHTGASGLSIEEVPPVAATYTEHLWLIDEFLNWLDDGPVPATAIDDNLKSVAMVFAAIEASRANQVVDVAGMVEDAMMGRA